MGYRYGLPLWPQAPFSHKDNHIVHLVSSRIRARTLWSNRTGVNREFGMLYVATPNNFEISLRNLNDLRNIRPIHFAR